MSSSSSILSKLVSIPNKSASLVLICNSEKKIMEEERKQKAHVLVLPYPLPGHINPMFQFAKRLVSKGLRVTLATTMFITKLMQAKAEWIGVEPISDGFDKGGYVEAGSDKAYHERFETVGSLTLSDLIKKHQQSSYPITYLVYDTSLPWALEVARRFGLPGAAFSTQSCAVLAIYYYVCRGFLRLPLSAQTVAIPGSPPLTISDLPSFLSAAGSNPSVLARKLDQFSNLGKADFVLFNTVDKLEAEVANWIKRVWRVKTIGPALPSLYLDKCLDNDEDYGIHLFNPNGGACMKWLDSRPAKSVVYVSFGSVATLVADQMEEIAWGLKESNYYFLWVVRSQEEHKLPENFTECSKNGLVLNWCPQLEVLAHRAIGCFVTHCGWNSVLEGLSLAVPMVAVPRWTDQPTNAKYVEDVWRVGVRARVDDKGVVRREEIKRCVRDVMKGDKALEIQRNACKWRDLIKEANSKGGSSDSNMEDFVEEVLSKQFCRN